MFTTIDAKELAGLSVEKLTAIHNRWKKMSLIAPMLSISQMGVVIGSEDMNQHKAKKTNLESDNDTP